MGQMKKVGSHKTTVSRRDGWMVVTYHETDVISWNDMLVRLDSGGFLTSTTKARINQASNQFDLGFRVYQDKGRWFVSCKGETFPFQDGMVFNYRGDSPLNEVTV